MTRGRRAARPDLVVVGAGIAGLTAALTAADLGARVRVLTKDRIDVSASFLAQGGVAAAVGSDDSVELHVRDTLAAGRGLCRESAVAVLAAEAPDRIADLRNLGVPFDEGLSLEGGHSRRRVVHAAGAETGRCILETLVRHARTHASLEITEGARVRGLAPGRRLATSRGSMEAGAVILASGGYAALWERTTNPPGSIGDGIALAHRAGASIADLEFVQFHPTVVASSSLLMTEALRGEGALLLDAEGHRFIDELAPRDVVARAVAVRGTVLLDLRPVDRNRFPALMRKLVEEGHDPARGLVPVTPAAHFSVGGIVTDADARTDVPGLYAAGECACTGVHGANRLASNSLLECLVFGRRAALAALRGGTPPWSGPAPEVSPGGPVGEATHGLRAAMWRHAGLVRSEAGLAELRGSPLLLVRLLVECAISRRESRGGHFRSDFPEADAAYDSRHTVIRGGNTTPILELWT